MSTVITYQIADTSPSPLRETVAMRLKALWCAFKAAQQRRASVRQLQMVDARTLSDIGMDRSEIKSIVYCGSAERRVSHEID